VKDKMNYNNEVNAILENLDYDYFVSKRDGNGQYLYHLLEYDNLFIKKRNDVICIDLDGITCVFEDGKFKGINEIDEQLKILVLRKLLKIYREQVDNTKKRKEKQYKTDKRVIDAFRFND